MFGHKCFLRIGQLDDSSISGLYRDSYELLSCNYAFGQDVDRNGKAQSGVQGGTLNLVYPNVPSKDFITWMLKSGKLENGALVICDANDVPLEKIYFEGAACTQMEVGQLPSNTKKGELWKCNMGSPIGILIGNHKVR